jgi:hypothetical protein
MAKSFITERDIRLLESLERYALMTTPQIHTSHFKATDLHTVLRRLRTLERRKLIRRHHGLKNGKLVWTSTKTGLANVGIGTPVLVNRNTIEHDVQLTEVRLLLDRLKIGKRWRGSHELRETASSGTSPEDRNSDVIPDALFATMRNREAKLIALEVELTAKSRTRYRRILDLYSFKKAINHIWYIVRPSKLGSSLLLEGDKLQRTMPDDWLAWTLLDDLLENHLKAKVYFQNAKCQTLEEFAPTSIATTARNYLPTRVLTP